MKTSLSYFTTHPRLEDEVYRLSRQQVSLCYHCHKCTAGCPVAEAMEYGPDKILRMITLGQGNVLLGSRDIWLCVGCYTCATYCPNGIDIAAVMDSLRQISQREGFPAGEKDTLLFHRLFLAVVRILGRSHEAATLGLFKILSHTPKMSDIRQGIGLFLRGKIPLLPGRKSAFMLPKGVENKPKPVREIFHQVRQK